MDYLAEAIISIAEARAACDASEESAAQSAAQIAIACALVALVERLDALTEFDDGGKALYIALTN